MTMRAIVGCVGLRCAVSVLVPGLPRLECRGYESAGIAMVAGTSPDVRKSTGKIAELEALLAPGRPAGQLGIEPTRWATHRHPPDANAHPYTDCHARIAIGPSAIGISSKLRAALASKGHLLPCRTAVDQPLSLAESVSVE